jgi:hypothetical protein
MYLTEHIAGLDYAFNCGDLLYIASCQTALYLLCTADFLVQMYSTYIQYRRRINCAMYGRPVLCDVLQAFTVRCTVGLYCAVLCRPVLCIVLYYRPKLCSVLPARIVQLIQACPMQCTDILYCKVYCRPLLCSLLQACTLCSAGLWCTVHCHIVTVVYCTLSHCHCGVLLFFTVRVLCSVCRSIMCSVLQAPTVQSTSGICTVQCTRGLSSAGHCSLVLYNIMRAFTVQRAAGLCCTVYHCTGLYYARYCNRPTVYNVLQAYSVQCIADLYCTVYRRPVLYCIGLCEADIAMSS